MDRSASSTPDSRRLALAYAQVLLAGSLWATSGPLSVSLYRMGIPPTSVALLRPLTGTLFLVVFVAIPVPWHAGPGQTRRTPSGARDLAGMVFLGGGIVALFQLAYQMSTEAVGVPATVALLYLAPPIVVAASAILFSERLSLPKALLAVGGVWLTVLGARGVDVDLTPRGILWGCTSGVTYAAYTLFGKRYGREHGPLVPLMWSTIAGSGLLGLVWWARGVPVIWPDSPAAWLVALLLGLLSIALAPLLLFNAMRYMDAGRASIGTTVEPLVAALLAWALLGQTLTPVGALGLVILVVGVAGAYGLRGQSTGTRMTASAPPSSRFPTRSRSPRA
ncbi:MAG: DMT family transporter [bacterium]